MCIYFVLGKLIFDPYDMTDVLPTNLEFRLPLSFTARLQFEVTSQHQ